MKTYELRTVIDGVEKHAIILEEKPLKVVLTLTSIETTETTTIVGSKEIVVP
jgi:hypothetical protein